MADLAAAFRTLFGYSAEPSTNADVPPLPPAFPTAQDVQTSKDVDLSYADPSAAFLDGTNGARMGQFPDFAGAARSINNGNINQAQPGIVDTPMADELHAAWLASRKSPVAALGFDPRHMTTTRGDMPLPTTMPPDNPPLPPPRGVPAVAGAYDRLMASLPDAAPPPSKGLNVAGVYEPGADTAWFDAASPTTPVHESIHRGLEKMRTAGVFPYHALIPEEMLTRLLMQRAMGPDVEIRPNASVGNKQVQQARDWEGILPKGYLDQLDAAASKLYESQRPGRAR